jgi:hypothetical protein
MELDAGEEVGSRPMEDVEGWNSTLAKRWVRVR